MFAVELDGLVCFRELFSRQGASRTQSHPRPEGTGQRQGAAAADLLPE
jgi:hypothetical protein